jgi:hypothetical protein
VVGGTAGVVAEGCRACAVVVAEAEDVGGGDAAGVEGFELVGGGGALGVAELVGFADGVVEDGDRRACFDVGEVAVASFAGALLVGVELVADGEEVLDLGAADPVGVFDEVDGVAAVEGGEQLAIASGERVSETARQRVRGGVHRGGVHRGARGERGGRRDGTRGRHD